MNTARFAPGRHDVVVYRRAPGKTTVDPQFFETLERYEQADDRIVLTFVEGGRVEIPLPRRCAAVWIEPERH
jgi:hypothetical protein